MLRSFLRHIFSLLLITAVFVPVAVILPLVAFPLCRTSTGGQIVFWLGPWSACFWTLVIHVFIGSKFWLGRGAVLAWRQSRGGYLLSCAKSTGVMFGALFFSYGLELAYVLTVPPSATARQLIPLVTYAPAAFTFWRAARG